MSATYTMSPVRTEAVRRRVRCVLETGTNTEGFLSDHAPIQKNESISLSSSDDSPTFFKSSSSVRETVYEAVTHAQPTTLPSIHHMNLDNHLKNYDNRLEEHDNHRDFNQQENYRQCGVVSPSISISKRTENITNSDIVSNKIIYSKKITTNPTLTDTLDFLFAPIKNANVNNENMKFEAQSKNLNSKRVNFDLIKTDVQNNYNFQSSSVFKSLVNRNLSSIMYNNEDLSSGDQDMESRTYFKGTFERRNRKFSEWKSYDSLEENLLTKSTKQLSNISELPYSKHDSYLPSNPEGDTCDSYSDMIKIYPKFTEAKHTRLQLFNYLHREESPISQYSTISDNITKKKSTKQLEKVKCQKIFSKYHKSLAMHAMGSDNHRVIKNQSMEIMKLFHETLTHIVD